MNCYSILEYLLKYGKKKSNKFEDRIGFIKQSINWAASHLATRRLIQGVVQSGSFNKKKVEARELLTK